MKVVQFWGRHITVGVLLGLLSTVLALTLGSALAALPRDSLPFLATIISALLGLTFTAFAIVSAFMPNLGRDYVGTETFLNIGRTFVVTLMIQMGTLSLSFLAYLLFSTRWYYPLLLLTMAGTVFSLGFMTLLIRTTFGLFIAARRHRGEGEFA